ncbi:hypothetical protein KR067_013096 [Drosophila pandora]|nr:hypothetical protein KR067_013096 [Drosophila pandora]
MTDKHLDLAYSRCVLATDYEQRLEQYERRLLLGSVAQTLDSSIHNGRWTHQFRVYIKALKEGEVAKAAADMDDSYEPLADYAQKVVFRFSDDCNDCIHIVESPPFESGTFCNNNTTVSVTLLFLDTSHTCTIFHHGVTMPLPSNSRSIQESVRTIIFVNPSDRMKGMLKIPVDVEPEIALESPRVVEMAEIRAQEPDEEQQDEPNKQQVENNPPDEQSEEDGDPQEDPQEKLGDEPPEKESESELGDEIEDYLKEILEDYSDDDLEEDSEDELEEIEEEQEEEVPDKDKPGKSDADEDEAPKEEEEEKELTEQELEVQRQQEELKKDLKRARRAMNRERRFIVNPGPRDL